MFPIAQSLSLPAVNVAAGGTVEWPSVGAAFAIGLMVLLVGSTLGLLRACARTTPVAQHACTGGVRADPVAEDLQHEAA